MTVEEIGVVAAIVSAAAILLTALVRELHAAAIERRRTQPIVIAHERCPGPRFHGPAWAAYAWLTNEGGGAAFNVRFGIELHSTRFPHRLDEDDPSTRNRQRVIGQGARLPPGDLDSLRIPLIPGEPPSEEPHGLFYLHPQRSYWARYENASGKTWETINPVDRSANLKIRRVRLRRLREWWEGRRRRKALQGLTFDEEFIEDRLAQYRTAPKTEASADDDEEKSPSGRD